MEKWQGKVALVTGASAGIGAATAVALANSGVKVAACARRVDKIEVGLQLCDPAFLAFSS
jgi:NADP-dependent 3-hydroxy acid dehydrogenase YdfG